MLNKKSLFTKLAAVSMVASMMLVSYASNGSDE